MSKFKIEKKEYNVKNQIMFRFKDKKHYEAFVKACNESSKTGAGLAHEMVLHCLKEAGYL